MSISLSDRPAVAPSEQRAPAGRRRARLAVLLQLAAGGLAFCLFLEILVTLVFGEQVKFPRHVVDGGFGLRINEPNARYRHKSRDVEVWFRINGQGLRADRDFAYPKPPGLLRIVSIGDSFTAGYEVEAEDCFNSVMERELRELGYEVEVLNAGVSGYGNAEACAYLERELLKYDPDLVLLSFFNNDLVDNVRSDLYGLEDGLLVARNEAYIPLGGLGDFLNTNPIFNFLSERSNAFALLKEQATYAVKRKTVEENVRNMETGPGRADEQKLYQRRLAAAILDRVHDLCRAAGIPLVIQDIPLLRPERDGPGTLIDVFPYEEFGLEREGFAFLPATSFLEPHVGQRALYHLRSHMHWTPLANRLSGQALAELIVAQGLLERPRAAQGSEPAPRPRVPPGP